MSQSRQTAAEFAEHLFHDEAACLAYLESVRWPAGQHCPKCQNDEVLTMKQPYYRCNSDDCGGYDFTVRSKTLFEGSRLRLRIWFQAIWYFVNQQNGVSAVVFQKHLHLGSNHTALKLLKTLRLATAAAVQHPLSGSVDVDEFYLNNNKLGKVLVLIAVQSGTNSKGSLIRVMRVAEPSTSGLLTAVSKLVCAGSAVSTDAWPGYDDLKGRGYAHNVIRASQNLGDNLLPRPKRVAQLLRRWLETQRVIMTSAQLDQSLNEFAFRFNPHNANPGRTLFNRLIEQAVITSDASETRNDLLSIWREVSPSA
jgi:hypothetical protein